MCLLKIIAKMIERAGWDCFDFEDDIDKEPYNFDYSMLD